MKIRTLAALSAAALMTAGCAASASSVQPAYVPASRYAHMDCPAARAELEERTAAEADLSRRQDTAAQRDTAGVALVGLPVGSLLRGDVEAQLAQAKGEVRALREHIQTRCSAGA